MAIHAPGLEIHPPPLQASWVLRGILDGSGVGKRGNSNSVPLLDGLFVTYLSCRRALLLSFSAPALYLSFSLLVTRLRGLLLVACVSLAIVVCAYLYSILVGTRQHLLAFS